MGRVTLDRQGRWHVSFPAPQAPVERTPTGAVVGIDRGVANTLTTSEGEHRGIPTPTGAERARTRSLRAIADAIDESHFTHLPPLQALGGA